MSTNEKHGNDNKFCSRAIYLRTSWINNRESLWNNVDSVVFPLGQVDENVVYKKSSAMHLYLSGSEYENTLFLFTLNKLIIISSNEKLKKLSPLFESIDKSVMSVECLGYEKSFSECKNELNEKLESENNIHSMGLIVKDKDNKLFENSSIIKDFLSYCEDEKKYELKDISDGTTDLLSVKDSYALNSIMKSCKVTSKWMSHCFISELEQILDQEKKISHSSFAIQIENSIKTPKLYKLNADPKYIDSCYTPIIESGGKYDLKPSAISNDDNLSPDTIICSMGAKYKDYCSNVSRTFFVDGTKEEEEAYKLLLRCLDVAIKNMKSKNSLKDVSDSVIKEVNKSKSELLPNLMKSFGCGIGLQFRESGLTITPKNTKELKKDMIFYVSVGLKELKLKNGKISSILIGDTVQVEDHGGKRLTDVTRDWDDIYYTFRDDNNNEIFDATEILDMAANNSSNVRNLRRRPEQSLEANRDKRREHQLQLIKQKQKENLKNRSDHVEEDDNDSYDDIKDLSSYKSSNEFPKDIRRTRIYVDKEKEVVFIPINGLPVPFHIITIKNISKTEGEDHSLLRFNFHIPSSANMKGIDPIMAKACQMNPLSTYIKTLNVKFYDTTHLDELVLKINECLKRIKQRIIDRENEADLVEQPNLILTRSVRAPLLRELNVRPSASRKANGIIEAHENGFRFKSQKGETIDILYTNIQHAIFQKCDKTNLLVILHFHLKHPIMIGKKKCADVQFYSEAADATINVDGSRRSAYDADEVEEEQREIRFRKRLNATFKNFIEQAEKIADSYHLEFEKPYSIGFTGVPDREMVYLQPTDSCLINITNTPFFVVTLSDVEHVHFERVISGTKEFDMCIIFKDHNRPVVRISSIAMDKLDMIETWLDNIDMTFTEGIANLNWKLTITAADDPLFWEDHDEDNNPKAIGWMGLDMTGGAGSESEGEESEDDEEYKSEEDEDEGDEEEEDDDDMDEDVEEDEEEAEEEDESDEEEDGEDWDELDRKAAEEDRNALKRERNLNEADRFKQVKKRRR